MNEQTGIEPWLSVPNGAEAVEHYANALGAVETYRLDGDDGAVLVARLEIDGAGFWVQEDPEHGPGGGVRMIVSVGDPDAWFDRAIAAGATEIAAVHEEHGWRTGRVADRFGHDWEFSRQVES